MTDDDLPESWWTPADVAARFNVHLSTARRWMEEGAFPTMIKVGRLSRIPERDMLEAVERVGKGRA